jgi:hypothetical protein
LYGYIRIDGYLAGQSADAGSIILEMTKISAG